MAFDRADFTLFWTLSPVEQDWANLRLSRVRRVQLVGAYADAVTLARLRDAGVTHVTVRLNEGDYSTSASRLQWRDRVAPLVPLGVDTVIVGVEPENAFNLRYGS